MSLPFSETFAHPNDPLPQHLERVAQRAAASIAPQSAPQIREIAFLAGLFHDLGKATPWFQAYMLKGGKRSVLSNHAKVGALLSWWYSSFLDWELWQRMAVFIAVYRHHGALDFETWRHLLERVRSECKDPEHELFTQIKALDLVGIGDWLLEVAERHPQFKLPSAFAVLTVDSMIAQLRDQGRASGSKLRKAFTTLDQALCALAGFGALLALDKTDAALSAKEIMRQTLPANGVSVYKAQAFANKPIGLGSLDERRQQIADAVVNTWLHHWQQPLLTLTAPTGSGKTLSILHAALQVRQRIEQEYSAAPRIIYCLPFTAVIDQNYAVFRSVLLHSGIRDREDILLKHHHLTDTLFRTDNAEYQADGAGQLLTETWQSELVVTTFHQLLYSLLSARNANLKRAGQLTGALVLLDEVQALPLQYWEGLRRLFIAAARQLGTRFVLLTATRPLIFQVGDAVELLEEHKQHFKAMQRTVLHYHQQGLGVDDFAAQMLEILREDQRATLIVVNRRRTVTELFAAFSAALLQRPIVALSTNFTPIDRRARIRLIQRLLRQNQPLIVIATQLVEAGVDFSFPVVHRDFAPLDALIQAAGRCNRHAENGATLGEVHIWKLRSMRADGSLGEWQWQRVYDSILIQVTEQTLGSKQLWQESEFLELSERYFNGCCACHDPSRIDEQLIKGDFLRIESSFRLIEDNQAPTVTVFVERGPRDRRLWEKYQAIHTAANRSASEQERLFYSFKHDFYERVIQVYRQQAPSLECDQINRLIAAGDTYNREVGFVGTPEEKSVCVL